MRRHRRRPERRLAGAAGRRRRGRRPDLPAVLATVAASPQAATALAVLLRAAASAVSPMVSSRSRRPTRRCRPAPSSPVGGRRGRSASVRKLTGRRCAGSVTATRCASPSNDPRSATPSAAGSGTICSTPLRSPPPTRTYGSSCVATAPATAAVATSTSSAPAPTRPPPTWCGSAEVRAWLLSTIAERVTVHVHGACAGSGVELPAFAGQVIADRGTTFALPEVSLGLVPGAGGTVSLPARVGRHRTALLALIGRPIDVASAKAWGLVDAVA